MTLVTGVLTAGKWVDFSTCCYSIVYSIKKQNSEDFRNIIQNITKTLNIQFS